MPDESEQCSPCDVLFEAQSLEVKDVSKAKEAQISVIRMIALTIFCRAYSVAYPFDRPTRKSSLSKTLRSGFTTNSIRVFSSFGFAK